MRSRLLIGLLLAGAVFAGCQGAPPSVIYVVISPTPETTEAATAELTAVPTTEAGANLPTPSETLLPPTDTPTLSPTDTLVPTNTAVPATEGPTALPPGFPTPVIDQIQIAEELFEHGRMFWIGPIQQIWVLFITGEGHGTWSVYQDTFVDGEPENDPSLVPPDGRYQPQRGFGKLWRESPGLRDQLGWGVTPEFGYVSNYEYHAGGTIDANGSYVPGPGYHILFSLGGELFRFNEADGTWQLGNN